MTSRQTEPESSSMLGWKIRFMNPMEGDLYGYWSGSSTWTFHTPLAKGAVRVTRCRNQHDCCARIPLPEGPALSEGP